LFKPHALKLSQQSEKDRIIRQLRDHRPIFTEK